MNLREQIEKEITDKVMVKLEAHKVELSLVDDINKLKSIFVKNAKAADKSALSVLSNLADSTKALEDGIKIAQSISKMGKDLGMEAAIKLGKDTEKQFNTTLSNHRKAINAAREIRSLVS